MGRLYEIDAEMSWLMEQLEVDEETGEISATSDDIIARLDQLTMERKSVLQYLAKVILDFRAEEAMLKAEEERLNARRKVLERKEERLLQVLDRECDGVKTDLGVATLQYRKTTSVDVADSAKAIRWLQRHKMKDCIRIRDPEVDKAAVKLLLRNGT